MIGTSVDKSPVRRTTSKPLTERTILALKAGQKRADGQETPGFGRLIVRAVARQDGGAEVTVRQFYFRYQDRDGRDRTLFLGTHGAAGVSLLEARAKAKDLREGLRAGVDPRFQREEDRRQNLEAERLAAEKAERERRRGTLQHLVDAYVADLRRRKRQSADDTERTLKRHLLDPFPDLARRAASEITADDVSNVMAKMIAGGIERRTNIVRAMLSAAFTFAAAQDNDPVRKALALRNGAEGEPARLFGVTSNPAALVKSVKEFERAGDRVLSDEELRHYWSALGALNPAVGGCLRAALLLGGQRLSQLKRARWSDYSEPDRTLVLSDAKGKGTPREHLLPVSDEVAAILDSMRLLSPSGPIFSTTEGRTEIDLATLSSSVTDIARAFVAAQQGNAEPYSARDLRRTVETRMAKLQISKDIRAQVLSHGRTANVQDRHYDRYKYLPEKQAALAKWERHLTQVLRGEAPRVIRGVFREAG